LLSGPLVYQLLLLFCLCLLQEKELNNGYKWNY
jgi:hypothetical protein